MEDGMSHAIEFIETSLFTRQIRLIATDDELKTLQCELIGVSLEIGNFCTLSTLFNQLGYVSD